MEIKIVDPTDYPDWDKIISESFEADIFHSAEWCQVLKSTYKFHPAYFAGLNNGSIRSLIPLMEVRSLITGDRAVGLPFSDYCNFLGKSENDLQEIIEQIFAYGRNKKWKYLEFRSRKFLGDPVFSEIYYTHEIDLTRPASELWSSLKENNRRNIKKAMREGVKIKFENNLASLESFYRLQVMTRKRHGLPPQPYNFFRNILNDIISKGLGIIIAAYYQEQLIAVSIFFNFNQKAIYKYGASDARYHYLRPNNLVMWEGLNWHRENGCLVLNLGRTDPEDAGLLTYKRLWGAKESELKYRRFDFKKNAYVLVSSRSQKLAVRISKFMPKSLMNLVGRIIYRHFG